MDEALPSLGQLIMEVCRRSSSILYKEYRRLKLNKEMSLFPPEIKNWSRRLSKNMKNDGLPD